MQVGTPDMQVLSWVNILFQNHVRSYEVHIKVGLSPVQDVANGVSVEEVCFTVSYVSCRSCKNLVGLTPYHRNCLLPRLFEVVAM